MHFRSEDEVGKWCRIEGRAKGAVLRLEQVWDLSQLWYRDRMSARFRGRTAESAIDIFRKLNLTDDFWTVPPS